MQYAVWLHFNFELHILIVQHLIDDFDIFGAQMITKITLKKFSCIYVGHTIKHMFYRLRFT